MRFYKGSGSALVIGTAFSALAGPAVSIPTLGDACNRHRMTEPVTRVSAGQSLSRLIFKSFDVASNPRVTFCWASSSLAALLTAAALARDCSCKPR